MHIRAKAGSLARKSTKAPRPALRARREAVRGVHGRQHPFDQSAVTSS